MPMVDGLSERFQENVECSTHVDIVVAWATETSALIQLVKAVKENGISLRIIVGTHGNATDPDVLDRLNEIGELRIVPYCGPRDPLFHPKVYIFRRKEASIAWIGSANFTKKRFGESVEGENVEAVFETKQLRSVRKWFKSQWKQCGKLPVNKDKESRDKAIKMYRERRRGKPPFQVLTEIIGKPMRDPGSRLEYLDQAQDWSGYVKALRKCQKWWKGRGCTVYGATHSWTHTIGQVGPLATMDDWSNLNLDEIRKLLGIYKDKKMDSGLLGVRRPIQQTRFLEDMGLRNRLNGAVQTVVNAQPTDFPRVAVAAVDNIITEERDIGIGVATRILALARPDRVVSVSGKSKKELAKIFPGIDRLETSDDYGAFLGQLYAEPWFDSKEPSDACEQRLWSMRAALLDCFVYSV